jgi:hypothetical protein
MGWSICMARKWSTGLSKGYVLSPMVTLLYSPNFKNNIFINNNGRACIADFGSFTIAGDKLTDTPSSALGGAPRWMSPELIDPVRFGLADGHPTKGSDCYALGMVVYEVLSGKLPFASSGSVRAMIKILGGEHPRRPRGKKGKLFTDEIWSILELCWKLQPHDRISASTVLLRLEEHPPLLVSSSNMDEDAGTGGDERWESSSDDESGSGSDDELWSDSDDESGSGSDDEWHSAESDCMFSPFRPGLMFDSPCVV